MYLTRNEEPKDGALVCMGNERKRSPIGKTDAGE
jgi:hypothetical protein